MTKKFTNKTSTADMVKYAAENLGIDLSELERKEVIAELKKEDPELFTAEKVSKDEPAEEKGNPTHVTIMIHDNDDDDEFAENYVPVGVNGRMFQVQKGVEAKVPYGVYDVLKNAVETNYKQRTDPETKMKYLEEKKVQRWPFNTVQKHY